MFVEFKEEQTDDDGARLCIYCGEPGVNSEHLFGKWLNKLHPSSKRTQIRTRVGVDQKKNAITLGMRHKVKNGGNFSSHVRRICLKCNGTWLSAVQHEAKAIIKRLSADEIGDVSLEDQTHLLRWIVNAVILNEFNDFATAAIPSADYLHYYKTRTPPQNWIIGIGRYSGKEWKNRVFHMGALALRVKSDEEFPDTEQPPNVQTTIITIGALLIMVHSAVDADMLKRFEHREDENIIHRIWPARSAPIPWPSTYFVTDSQLDEQANVSKAVVDLSNKVSAYNRIRAQGT